MYFYRVCWSDSIHRKKEIIIAYNLFTDNYSFKVEKQNFLMDNLTPTQVYRQISSTIILFKLTYHFSVTQNEIKELEKQVKIGLEFSLLSKQLKRRGHSQLKALFIL